MTTPINELQQMLTAEDKILQACTHYRKRTDEYLNFLKKTRTSESLKNIDTCNQSSEIWLSKIDLAMETLREHHLALTKAKFTKTRTSMVKQNSHSGSSNASDMSSLALRKRANAEAAKSKIAFAEKHALIIKQGAL